MAGSTKHAGLTLAAGISDMFALLLFVVLATVAYGIISAVTGRGKYRWIALASAALAVFMLASSAVLLLGSGVVAIGTSGSVARVLIGACLLSMAIACLVCVISGSIAIRKRGSQNVA